LLKDDGIVARRLKEMFLVDIKQELCELVTEFRRYSL
jgi:hypothetical protein